MQNTYTMLIVVNYTYIDFYKHIEIGKIQNESSSRR
jgi:hypothetical protein